MSVLQLIGKAKERCL